MVAGIEGIAGTTDIEGTLASVGKQPGFLPSMVGYVHICASD